MKRLQNQVVIIGGGVGGLAVANLLAAQGYTVDVYEQHDQLGGRMGLLKKDGFTFDLGPSWYLMPEVFEQYFSLLGCKPDDFYTLERLTPAYKVFFDYARPVTIQGNVGKDARTFDALQPGAGDALVRYVSEAKNVYQLALQYFLYNPFRSFLPLITSKDVLRQTPKLVMGLSGSLHNRVKKEFSVLQLQQILEYAMVFLGTSPFDAPSLYRLMSYLDFEQGVYFPKGGMYKVTEALIAVGKKFGVRYHTGATISSITVTDGIARGIVVNGSRLSADFVISNADLAFTETKLLPEKYQTYTSRYWKSKKAAPAALLLYLGVKGSLPQLEHHNLLFVKQWQKNFSDIYTSKQWPKQASIYVSKTSASDATVAPKGHENLFVLVPLPPGKTMSAAEQSRLAEKYISYLAQHFDIPNLAQRIVAQEVRGPAYFAKHFNAWQNSALGLNHILRQSAFLRPSVKSKKVSNLYYVGGMVQPGIGVPMCLISAELVIKAITGDRSPGPLPNLGDKL